jgi:amidase
MSFSSGAESIPKADVDSGLPISLKNQVPIKGVEQTMGWVGGLGEFSEKDALIATHLEKQGVRLCP